MLKQPGATEAWDLAVADGYLLCASYDVNLFQALPFLIFRPVALFTLHIAILVDDLLALFFFVLLTDGKSPACTIELDLVDRNGNIRGFLVLFSTFLSVSFHLIFSKGPSSTQLEQEAQSDVTRRARQVRQQIGRFLFMRQCGNSCVMANSVFPPFVGRERGDAGLSYWF